MKFQLGSLILVLTSLFAPLAWTQSGSSGSSSGGSSDTTQNDSTDSSQPQPSSTGPKQVFTHPEQRPSLALLDEVTAPSFIQLGLALGSSWDSDAGAFASRGFSQTLLTVGPSITLQQIRPSAAWDLAYEGGFMYAPNRTYYNSLTNTAAGNILWQLSPRWQLTAHDNYVYTADPFQAYLVDQGTPTYNQPNPTIYIPLATLEQNAGNLNLTYLLDAHDSLTFTGSEGLSRYLHTTYALFNSFSFGGLAAYQHVLSARAVVGGAYSFDTIDIGHGVSRSGITMFQAYGSYQLNPHMVVTGWIGPEITHIKDIIPILCTPYGCFKEIAHQSSFSVAFGGSLGWRGVRNSASMNFSKQVSDGGGLLGVVRLYMAGATYMRQLSPRWDLSLGGQYGSNLALSKLYYNRHLDSLTGTVTLLRRFNQNWNANVQYMRWYERQANIFTAAVPKWGDNRLQLTLQYNWGHSLGR